MRLVSHTNKKLLMLIHPFDKSTITRAKHKFIFLSLWPFCNPNKRGIYFKCTQDFHCTIHLRLATINEEYIGQRPNVLFLLFRIIRNSYIRVIRNFRKH